MHTRHDIKARFVATSPDGTREIDTHVKPIKELIDRAWHLGQMGWTVEWESYTFEFTK